MSSEIKVEQIMGMKVFNPNVEQVPRPLIEAKDRLSSKKIFSKYESFIAELTSEHIVSSLASDDREDRRDGIAMLRTMSPYIFEKRPTTIAAGPSAEGEISEDTAKAIQEHLLKRLEE